MRDKLRSTHLPRALGVFFLVASVGGVACSSGAGANGTASGSPKGQSSGASTGQSASGSTGASGGAGQSGSIQPGSGSTVPGSGASSGEPTSDASVDAEPPVDAGPPPPDPVITLSNGTMELQVWNPRTIRVIYGNGTTTPMPGPSLAVNQPRPSTPFTVNDGATMLTVTTSQLEAQVDKSSGQVTFLTPGGTVIFSEASTSPHQLNQATSGPGPYTSIGTFTPKGGE